MIWSYDFVENITRQRQKVPHAQRHPARSPATACQLRVDQRLTSTDVIDVLSDLFILRGVQDRVHRTGQPLGACK